MMISKIRFFNQFVSLNADMRLNSDIMTDKKEVILLVDEIGFINSFIYKDLAK